MFESNAYAIYVIQYILMTFSDVTPFKTEQTNLTKMVEKDSHSLSYPKKSLFVMELISACFNVWIDG